MRIGAPLCLLSALTTGAFGTAEAAQGAPAASGRVFEMRTYTASPGKLEALNARFRDHTVALFKKHGMGIVGFWEPVDKEAGAGEKLVYIVSHQSRAAAEASWKAFREDPDWLKVKADSEARAGGSLTSKIETVFLVGTDYSPLK